MKKLFRLGFTAIALTFAFSTFAATESMAQTNEILKRMDEHYKALKSLRTNVSYETIDPNIRVPDVKQGKAIFLPQKGKDVMFRVDWTRPEESLAVINKKYVIYRPRLKQAITGNTNSVKDKNTSGVSSPLAFINMSKAELKANYDIKYLGEEKLSNGVTAWHLELTPKTDQKYKKAEIWVDGNGMPIQMKVVEKSDDTSTVLLSNLEKNVALKGSDFQINPPSGTKIVKN